MKKNLFGLTINYISKLQLMNELICAAQSGIPAYLCAVNSHMVVESQHDITLKNAILNAQWAVTDGVPVSWAFSFYNKVKQERVAGMDITPELITLAEKQNLIVSVYGNTEKNLEGFRKYITTNHPKLNLGVLISPPFRSIEDFEEEEFIGQINASKTNILFVSLGCPKQEKWMLKNSHKIRGVCLGIGNAINTMIGEEKRPPKLIQNIGMEWFYRLVQDPKRLFIRYLTTNSRFCWLVIKNLPTKTKR